MNTVTRLQKEVLSDTAMHCEPCEELMKASTLRFRTDQRLRLLNIFQHLHDWSVYSVRPTPVGGSADLWEIL